MAPTSSNIRDSTGAVADDTMKRLFFGLTIPLSVLVLLLLAWIVWLSHRKLALQRRISQDEMHIRILRHLYSRLVVNHYSSWHFSTDDGISSEASFRAAGYWSTADGVKPDTMKTLIYAAQCRRRPRPNLRIEVPDARLAVAWTTIPLMDWQKASCSPIPAVQIGSTRESNGRSLFDDMEGVAVIEEHLEADSASVTGESTSLAQCASCGSGHTPDKLARSDSIAVIYEASLVDLHEAKTKEKAIMVDVRTRHPSHELGASIAGRI